ncbi:MAG: type VI secretion system tube protein Hcp [Succinimonas sp.]|nr:type VI secretion system tube protein Hcp [Succinimonas sp.]
MASDFFIKLDGIDGESADKGHGKWIEVVDFKLGSMQNVTSGRSTDVSGRGTFMPFTFTHLLDKASPKIQQYCMNGSKIAKVQFNVCRAIAGVQVPVYEVTMEQCKIVKAAIASVVAGAEAPVVLPTAEKACVPVEVVDIVASKITWKYTAIKDDNTKDGAVEASFNQVENA